MANEFKSNIQKPSDAQIIDFQKGHPFGQCPQCGLRITSSQVVCNECERLMKIGFGPVPRAFHTLPGQDTQPNQSHPSGRHDGYEDFIPSEKFPPGKERV